MDVRALVIGLAVSGVLVSSCASTARDTLVDIYNDEVVASNFDEVCRIQHRTYATATDAYVAAHGTMPKSTTDLVPELLLETPEEWEFDASSDFSFAPSPGGRCDGVDLERDAPSTFGQDAVDRIDDTRDSACESDKRQVEIALEAHFVVNGYDATAIGELEEFGVKDDLNRWTLEIPADATNPVPMVVATVGGPCDN